MHSTSGRATIYQETDGKLVLRLTHFKTSNGPDVHFILIAAKDADAALSGLHPIRLRDYRLCTRLEVLVAEFESFLWTELARQGYESYAAWKRPGVVPPGQS